MRALLLLAFCATAQAQTFNYIDSVSGTIQSLQSGATSVSSAAANGSLTAQLVFSGGVLTSFSAAVTINGVYMPVDFGPWQGLPSQGPVWAASTGLITQASNGGFDWNIQNQIYHYGSMDLQIGSSDEYSFAADIPGTCGNLLGPNGAAYSGPSISLCSLSVKGAGGVWVDPPTVNAGALSAPEIDAKGGIAAFLLLAGGLAVVRGRRAYG